MKTPTFILTMIALLLCSNLFAQTNGSISARSLILTDAEGRKVTLIPQKDAPIGDYVFEVPLIPILASTGDPVDNGLHGLGRQFQQAPADPEPYITFTTGSNSLTNNRIATAGSGISLTTASTDNGSFTIANTGVLSASAGTGIGLNATTGNITITNNGLLSASAGSGISVATASGNATITNTGVLSNIAGSGISLSGTSGNVTISNTGLLAATSGAGISVSTTSGNATIANTGVLSLTAGTGISITSSTGNITLDNTGVTSVGVTMPAIFSVSNSPITTTGTIDVVMNDQAHNTFLAGPVSGSDAAPTFRALDFADFDALVWTLQGNNVTAGAYIGTTNSEPFDMRVNGSTRLILTDRVSVQRDNAGDLRGYYSTDMQAVRSSSNQVASANYSTISGGRNNRASAIGSTIGGGGTDGYSDAGNIASARGTTIAGGKGNEANVDLSTIGGGDFNTAGGYVSSINGGEFNLAADYGAAVSGGISNTAGAELAFVGGGTENSASGVRSVIGGGQGNTASNDYAVIPGGQGNTASGVGAVAMGTGNSSSGSRSMAFGGGVGASGDYSVAMGGFGNAMGNFSQSSGLNAAATRHGQSARGSGAFATIGDAQHSDFVARNTSSDSSWTELYLDGSSATLTIPSGTAWTYVIHITGLSSTGNVGSYEIKGAVKNISGTTSLVGSAAVTTIAEDIPNWNVRVTGDDTNDKLTVEVLGDNGTTIRWVASISTTEVSN